MMGKIVGWLALMLFVFAVMCGSWGGGFLLFILFIVAIYLLVRFVESRKSPEQKELEAAHRYVDNRWEREWKEREATQAYYNKKLDDAYALAAYRHEPLKVPDNLVENHECAMCVHAKGSLCDLTNDTPPQASYGADHYTVCPNHGAVERKI